MRLDEAKKVFVRDDLMNVEMHIARDQANLVLVHGCYDVRCAFVLA